MHLCTGIAPRDKLIALGSLQFIWRNGEPLQKREGLEVLDHLKQQMSAQTFNAYYLQDPLPDTGNLLNPKLVETVRADPGPAIR
jgi:hypothetical protein